MLKRRRPFLADINVTPFCGCHASVIGNFHDNGSLDATWYGCPVT